MDRFFINIDAKPTATGGDRLVWGIIGIVQSWFTLFLLAMVVGYGFRLGFGG